MNLLKDALSVLIGLGSGVVIAGAVVAFITMVGAITRLAQKTGTKKFVQVYETAVMIGGIFGCVANLFTVRLPLGDAAVAFAGLCNGIFFGVLAMSLAETLNVIPILSRRGGLQKGMFFFILAIALGKLAGSLLYFTVPGFFSTGAG